MSFRRKRRPRPVVWLAAALLAVLVLVLGWYRLELRPVSGGVKQVQYFTVSPGDHPGTVAAHLAQAHLIRSRTAFLIYVGLHGQLGHLQAGIYTLAPSQDSASIADTVAAGKVAIKLLVVPEGETAAQVAQLVPAVEISAASFQAALHDTFTGLVTDHLTAGAGPEGYLFPDTYQITPGMTAHQLIQNMIDTFNAKVPAADGAADDMQGLSLRQAVTLASIVQREVSSPADQAMVAQVFLNRLRAGMSLESDVTAKYASDLAGVPFSTAIDSPYNTYIVKGLPAGPICSPGLSALNAVAHPTLNNYLYFLAGRDGKTYYARTFAEHQANIRAHL